MISTNRKERSIECPRCWSTLVVRRRFGYSLLDDLEVVEAEEDADDRYQREQEYAKVTIAVLAVALIVLVVLVGAFVLEYSSVFDMFMAWFRLSLQSLLS